MKDRLYLVEMTDEEEEEEDELINPQQCRRILALSLQGDTLQVYTHPDEGQHFDGLCCLNGKLLLALVQNRQSGDYEDVVALCGV